MAKKIMENHVGVVLRNRSKL